MRSVPGSDAVVEWPSGWVFYHREDVAACPPRVQNAQHRGEYIVQWSRGPQADIVDKTWLSTNMYPTFALSFCLNLLVYFCRPRNRAPRDTLPSSCTGTWHVSAGREPSRPAASGSPLSTGTSCRSSASRTTSRTILSRSTSGRNRPPTTTGTLYCTTIIAVPQLGPVHNQL